MSLMRVILVLLLLILFTYTTSALKNPSAVYCEALGYEFVIFSSPYGEVGKCLLPNGTAVDAWDFYKGKVAIDYSYCAKMGYEAKHVEREDCKSYLVCVLPNGTEVEVAELMGLSFEETTCGDGVCGIPENHSSCPQDCKSGGEDGYCDGVKDEICDPDCLNGEDVDCINETEIEAVPTITAPTTTPTSASPTNVPTTSKTPSETPGFEIIEVLFAVSILIAWRRR